ncbi:MAG: hypothetical protein ACYC3Q_04520 [Gemmatimonadaceae bacterium]
MFGFLDTTWAIALAILIAVASTTTIPAFPAVTALVGSGWGQYAAMAACTLCAAGGFALLAGGPAAIAVAAFTPGSAYALAACIAACGAAIS